MTAITQVNHGRHNVMEQQQAAIAAALTSQEIRQNT